MPDHPVWQGSLAETNFVLQQRNLLADGTVISVVLRNANAICHLISFLSGLFTHIICSTDR